MSFDKISKTAVRKLTKDFPHLDFTDSQIEEVRGIIESAMKKAVAESTEIHRTLTVRCCGAEADHAHNIAEHAADEINLLMLPTQLIR